MEYQKSSAALDLATQLLDGGKCLATNPILSQRAQKKPPQTSEGKNLAEKVSAH